MTALDASAHQTFARALPYPLGWKYGSVLRSAERLRDGEAQPQLAFDVFALVSMLLRTAAIVSVKAYVACNGADSAINRTIHEKFAGALVDEAWLELARRVVKAKGLEASVAARLSDGLRSAPVPPALRVPNVGAMEAHDLEYLIALRNHVAHGGRISPEQALRTVDLVAIVLTRFDALAEHRLVVRTGAGEWLLEGDAPRAIVGFADLPIDEPCLVAREGGSEPLSLSPLLRFRPSSGDVEIDELFFLNAASLERLQYVAFRNAASADGAALGSYEAFRELMKALPAPPVPSNPRLDFAQLAEDGARFFVGREGVIAAIEAFVRARPAPYGVVRALAGMGKTSLLSRLHQLNPPARAGDKTKGDRWCWHFCGNSDGRNSPVVSLRSLMAQLSDATGLPEELRKRSLKSLDLKELRDELFPGMLAAAAGRLTEGEHLVLVIDALDEGFGTEEPIASVLPPVLPPNAVAFLSYRVDDHGRNARVEGALRLIAPGDRVDVPGANPLRGLSREHVTTFLEHLRRVLARQRGEGEPSALPSSVLERVWSAAQTPAGDADPFYLRFVHQGAEAGTLDLDRAESIPTSLDDAFEEAWLALPTDRNFALQRMLLYLAILREPASDSLIAELLTRERPAAPLRPEDVALMRVSAGKLLAYDGDRFTLFHDRFKRFLVGEQNDPIAEALGER